MCTLSEYSCLVVTETKLRQNQAKKTPTKKPKKQNKTGFVRVIENLENHRKSKLLNLGLEDVEN